MKRFILLTILVASFASCTCNKQRYDIIVDTTQSISTLASFYSYSTVDWKLLDTLYYRQYNYDLPDSIINQMNPGFPIEKSMLYCHLLQNAKTYFHQQTLPLHAVCSKNTIKQLESAEKAFDSVFIQCVTQEYYLRIFPDCYQQLVPKHIDCIFESMQH